MKKHQKQDQFKVCDRNSQLVLALNNEILLPENAPVRLTSARLEGLDYRELYRAYSPKGQKTEGRSTSAVQGSGVRVSVRDLVQPKAGGGLSVSSGLHVAVRGISRTGPCNLGALPYRKMRGSGGGSVLPVVEKQLAKVLGKAGRIANMSYDEVEDCFTCAQGRKLLLQRACTELKNGHFVTTAHYRCENCKDRPSRNACCQTKDPERPKTLVLHKAFWEKRSVS